MSCACHNTKIKFDGLDKRYKNILWVVIAINAIMFFIEIFAGSIANSVSLKADALDFLGDTLTYGITLAVIGKSIKIRHMAAKFKAFTLAGFGVWVMILTIYHMFILDIPTVHIMSKIAIMAFFANLISVLLLYRFKDGDANIRSVWLCSRNDMLGNVAVMIAAIAVSSTNTAWPDLIVAGLMTSLFCHSAFLILKQIHQEQREDIHTI